MLVEIFYGDIGTVRNELGKFMKGVSKIVHLSQSVTASAHHTSVMITIVLVYEPIEEISPQGPFTAKTDIYIE